MRSTRVLFGLALAVLAVPVLLVESGAVSRVPAAGRPAALVWRQCDTSFRCAQLVVPLVYGHPGAGTVQLSVVELLSTSAHPEGDLVLNPGGPGASGVGFLESSGQEYPTTLRSAFNLVSFDPRGVGGSDPLSCGPASSLRNWIAADPVPSSPAQVRSVVAITKSFVAACEADSPRTLLANVGTVDTVQDLDRLRAALGEVKLNYMGLSYGTYLGELYAERFPSRVRSMVLDGAINPDLSQAAQDKQQAAGFEGDLKGFFNWCAATVSCRDALPGAPSQVYTTLMSRLRAGAVIESDKGSGDAGLPAVDYGIAEVGVIATLYVPATWPALGQALAAAIGGDGSVLAKLALSYEGLTATGMGANLIAANTAINCEDSGPLGSLSDYENLARQLAVEPDFGPSEAWGSLTCRYWPTPPSERPHPVKAAGAPSILVVGATGDPATPYGWAQAVSAELAHGVLLTRSGYGHTSYFFSSCVRAAVDRYLVNLVEPPAGTVCPTG